jgi:hypothetical protein
MSAVVRTQCRSAKMIKAPGPPTRASTDTAVAYSSAVCLVTDQSARTDTTKIKIR